MALELRRGIVDLDEAERMLAGDAAPAEDEAASSDGLPLWNPSAYPVSDGETDESDPEPAATSSLPPHLVLEARLCLSALGRPAGWYLRFPDRSCVHALVSHAVEGGNGGNTGIEVNGGGGAAATGGSDGEGGLAIGTDALTVESFDPAGGTHADLTGLRGFDKAAIELALDSAVLRVENCHPEVNSDQVRYLFRKYNLADERDLRRRFGEDNPMNKAVVLLLRGQHRGRRYGGIDSDEEDVAVGGPTVAPLQTGTFLVRFETAADARSALRGLQQTELRLRWVKLAVYPDQMMPAGCGEADSGWREGSSGERGVAASI